LRLTRTVTLSPSAPKRWYEVEVSTVVQRGFHFELRLMLCANAVSV